MIIFPALMAFFAMAGLAVDGWHGSAAARARVHPATAQVLTEFKAETARDFKLKPCIGKDCPL